MQHIPYDYDADDTHRNQSCGRLDVENRVLLEFTASVAHEMPSLTGSRRTINFKMNAAPLFYTADTFAS